jgi:2-succinyl-5-enolpyruvyl-6-hydroxy-3-cyclohexene-1-carboxylate synthase
MPATDPVVIGSANATFAATLVDEWIRCGVGHAVVAPGSRSTPLALALAERPEVALHVIHDERVAAFTALGLGLATGVPAVVVCTSGTAAANFHPAVVEAGLSDVPLLVCTADRPPELRGVGAPQTIDQVDLYLRAVRWSHDAPPPDASEPTTWRPLAQRAYAAAERGPVHLNLPFREPLVGAAGPLPDVVGPPLPVPRGLASTGLLDERFDRPRGVVVAGGRCGVSTADIAALAERLGWPILADPPSGLRGDPRAVTAFDSLLRDARFADAHMPELVIRFGRPPASKLLTTWVLAADAPVVQVGGPGMINPDHNVVAWCTPADLAPLAGCPERSWLDEWLTANARAEAAFSELAEAGRPVTEPGVARTVAGALPAGAELFVAASMPMRDLEWFGGPAARALVNRGANGIDGVMATALGVALTGKPVVVLIGDVAFLHDSNALLAAAQLRADLRVIVVDNAGGGIFSFLPQATTLAPERFEQLFGTPHTTDLCALARAHGIRADTVDTLGAVAIAVANPGPRVTRVPSERAANVEQHAAWHAAAVGGR